MKERSEKNSEKLPYRDRIKIKLTNQEERVKGKRGQEIGDEQNSKEGLTGKAQLIQQLIPIGLIALHGLLEAEVTRLAGARYGRGSKRSRWGTNPGWVYLGDQKVSMTVPRVRGRNGGEEMP